MKMMKCDPRAFARCPYRKECSDSPEHTSFYEGTECDYFNQQVIYAPLTNADRIRAMSDEELADWAINKAPNIGKCYTDSRLGVLDWLQQPAEEDT